MPNYILLKKTTAAKKTWNLGFKVWYWIDNLNFPVVQIGKQHHITLGNEEILLLEENAANFKAKKGDSVRDNKLSLALWVPQINQELN